MTLSKTLKKWSKSRKIVITTLVFVFPFGIYLMWKGQHFNKDLRWMLILMPIISAIYINQFILDKTTETPKNCSSTIIADGCTYHRDENCKVVSSSCED